MKWPARPGAVLGAVTARAVLGSPEIVSGLAVERIACESRRQPPSSGEPSKPNGSTVRQLAARTAILASAGVVSALPKIAPGRASRTRLIRR
jgi:hypothetical protein